MLLSFVFAPLKSINQDLLSTNCNNSSDKLHIVLHLGTIYDLFCLEYKFFIYHDACALALFLLFTTMVILMKL